MRWPRWTGYTALACAGFGFGMVGNGVLEHQFRMSLPLWELYTAVSLDSVVILLQGCAFIRQQRKKDIRMLNCFYLPSTHGDDGQLFYSTILQSNAPFTVARHTMETTEDLFEKRSYDNGPRQECCMALRPDEQLDITLTDGRTGTVAWASAQPNTTVRWIALREVHCA